MFTTTNIISTLHHSTVQWTLENVAHSWANYYHDFLTIRSGFFSRYYSKSLAENLTYKWLTTDLQADNISSKVVVFLDHYLIFIQFSQLFLSFPW